MLRHRVLKVSTFVLLFALGIVPEPRKVTIFVNYNLKKDFPLKDLVEASLLVANYAYVPNMGRELVTWNSYTFRFGLVEEECNQSFSVVAYSSFLPFLKPIQFDFPLSIVAINTLVCAAYNGKYPPKIAIAQRLRSAQVPREVWLLQSYFWKALQFFFRTVIGVNEIPTQEVRLMLFLMLWVVVFLLGEEGYDNYFGRHST